MERVSEKQLVEVEFHEVEMWRGHWRIWLHAPADLSQGTILRLHDDGRCEQVTLDEDGIESNYIKIKGPDSAN
jgi:hypothetical protein